LGTGTGYSVKEIVDEVEKKTGKKIHCQFVKPILGEPETLIANPLLAMQTLDWKPKFSSLETIITTALNWHKSHS
ncbi:MAG: UDP-glucose 4-epimerase GalE, partial [Chlamydiae bacterium]|nr:UDP-glucose 4-epimerase GalE [Chlamydiota bacterium]